MNVDLGEILSVNAVYSIAKFPGHYDILGQINGFVRVDFVNFAGLRGERVRFFTNVFVVERKIMFFFMELHFDGTIDSFYFDVHLDYSFRESNNFIFSVHTGLF